jgi:hypothetical protein
MKITSTLNGVGHVLGNFFCCLGEQIIVAVGQADIVDKTLKVSGLSLERTASFIIFLLLLLPRPPH